VKNEVDLIVNTVSADLEVETDLGLLAVDGWTVDVGMRENYRVWNGPPLTTDRSPEAPWPRA
jgi:hypothetical protein